MARKPSQRKAGSKHAVSGTPQVSFLRHTITIPPDMKAAVDALVGRGKFSAFAQRAFAHELQRESIAGWLDEREAARGGAPLDPEAVEFAEQAWRSRK